MHYLTTTTNKHLSPLTEQRKCSTLKPIYVNNWDCSFTEEIIHSNGGDKEQNDAVFQQLVSGFFEFLAKIKFNETVICTNSGEFVEKFKFSDSVNMETEGVASKHRRFRFGAASIQDPFELNHNVAGNVGRKQAELLLKNVKHSVLATKMTRFTIKSSE